MKPYLALTDNSLAAMKTFAESNGDPIVMVNLMQVRPNALYEPPLVDHCSGYEALARYTHESAAVRQAAGAELVWSSTANAYWAKRESLGCSGLSTVPECWRLSDYGSNRRLQSCSSAQNRRPLRL